jgi:hypothetical protein
MRPRFTMMDKVPLICIAFSVAQRRFATIDGRGYRILEVLAGLSIEGGAS